MEKQNKESAYEFWERIGNPKSVCAPMVDQSELSFRLLVGRHDCDLVYTPMYNASVLVRNKKYLNDVLYDHRSKEKTTFTQICGCDPDILLEAGKKLEGVSDAIDLNFGCPQMIAKRGNYGSFLLENTDQVKKIVGYLGANLKQPLTVKIRVFNDLERTYDLVSKFEVNY